MTAAKMTLDEANFEILKMARDLVINEYIDKRADMHNRWLVEADVLWKASKLALPYPSIPPYPTETDILGRARVLMDFVTVVNEKTPEQTIVKEQPESTQEFIQQPVFQPMPAQETKAHIELVPIEQPDIEEPPALPEHLFSQEENVEYALPKPSSTNPEPTARVIPAMFKKLEDIRSTWSSR
jgi:hypothetical protein